MSPKWEGTIDEADEEAAPSVEKIVKKPPREKDRGGMKGRRPRSTVKPPQTRGEE